MSGKIKFLIVVFILLAIIGVIIFASNMNKDADIKEENIQELNESVNTINEITNEIEENVVVDNTNSIEEKVETSNVVETQSNTVGQEEKESITSGENELENLEKAKKMAMDKWAIAVNYYNFEPSKVDNGIYEVIVRDKQTTYVLQKYLVNLKEGTIKEQ